MIVKYERYNYLKDEFFKKNEYDYIIETSSMDEYGSYHKEYIFESGKIWYEVYRPVYKEAEFEVNMVKIKTTVKLFETEFWNTDNATSNLYYEKF